jgi:prepilin-type N-terminal cleavage/methylation domain-containing protein
MKKRFPNSRRRSGFTLIEVLATLVLLGIILPAAMRSISVALAMAGHARHATEAATLAEAKLNELIATNAWQTGGSGDFGTDHPGYQWRCTSAQQDFSLSQITLTVAWPERGQERTFNLTTLAYEGAADTGLGGGL